MKTVSTLLLASIGLTAALCSSVHGAVPPPQPPPGARPAATAPPAPAKAPAVPGMQPPPAVLAPGANPPIPPSLPAAKTPPPPSTPPPPPGQPPGQALANAGPHSVPTPGLSPAEEAVFRAGKAVFLQVETAASGLGPLFNDVSCVACHFEGGAGGGSRTAVTRFGRVLNGVHDPLEALGGPLLQRKATRASLREVIPAEANVVAERITTPLFGAGLLEAVSDETLLTLAASSKPDGIRGRAAEVVDPISGQKRIGRLGWKAQHASLDAFAADAYLNEMGVTSPVFPKENAPNGKTALLAGEDKVADPEDIGSATEKPDFVQTAEFMRLLAPVPRAAAGGSLAATVLAGEGVFAEIGCAHCHVPALQTGNSSISALSNKPVRAYSDLLLHDMGSLGDGLAQGAAGLQEMRTAPLWGLRLRKRYLHDGRASTLELAVTSHDGEARTARDRFKQLTPARVEALLAFLKSL